MRHGQKPISEDEQIGRYAYLLGNVPASVADKAYAAAFARLPAAQRQELVGQLRAQVPVHRRNRHPTIRKHSLCSCAICVPATRWCASAVWVLRGRVRCERSDRRVLHGRRGVGDDRPATALGAGFGRPRNRPHRRGADASPPRTLRRTDPAAHQLIGRVRKVAALRPPACRSFRRPRSPRPR